MSRTPTFTTPDLTRPMFNGMPEPVDPSIAAGERKAAAQSDMLSLVSDIALGPVALGARGLGLSPSEPLATKFVDDHHKAARREATDSVVRSKRATTPQAAVEARAVPRASIAELNALDIDQVRERFSKGRYDDRGPLTRFLDLLDLPRNTIAGLIAPSIQRRKEAEGATGTFGQGTVRTSDILDDLGVENRVIRGVVGFIGDVALDPLTYLGPAGFGAKVAGSGGKAVQLTRKGSKLVEEAVNAAKVGKSAIDPSLAGFLKATGHDVADLSAAGRSGLDAQNAVATHLWGSGKKASGKALRVEGDPGIQSKLADYFHSIPDSATPAMEAEAARYAKEFVGKYGRQASPGVRIGKTPAGKLGFEVAGYGGGQIPAGSGVAHIPFTDYGVFVPAFTKRALGGAAQGVAASATMYAGRAGEAASQPVRELEAFGKANINPLVDTYEQATKRLADLDMEDAAIASGQAVPIEVGPGRQNVIQAERANIAAQLKVVKETLASAAAKAADMAEAVNANPLSSPSDVMYATKMAKAYEARLGMMAADDAVSKALPPELRKLYKSVEAEWTAKIDQGVKDSKFLHDDAEGVRRQLHAQEVEQVRGLNQAEEARRVMEGIKPHPVLGHDPLIPEPVFEPKNFDETATRTNIARKLRADYAETLSKEARDVFDYSPERLDAMEGLADAFHAKTRHAADLAELSKGPVLATMDGRDKALANAAEAYMGFGPDDLGGSPFAPMGRITRGLFGDKGDAAGQMAMAITDGLERAGAGTTKRFGLSQSAARDLQRSYLRSSKSGSNVATNETFKVLTDAMRKSGVKPEQMDDAGVAILALTIAGDKLPKPGSALYRKLEQLAKSGILDPTVNPGMRDKLGELAKQVRQMIDTDTEAALAAGRLSPDSVIKNYFPNVVTPEAASRIAGGKSWSEAMRGGTTSRGKAASQVVESYQKPRGTIEFTNPDGSSFLEGQRVYKAFSKDDLAAFPPAVRAHMEEAIKAIDKYDAMPLHRRPEGAYLNPFDVEEMVRNGSMGMLTGGELNGTFFDQNAVTALASRFGASERHYLRDMVNEAASKVALSVNEAKLTPQAVDLARKGQPFRLQSGAMGRIEMIDGKPNIWVGSQRFRKPDVSLNLSAAHDPTNAVYDTDLYSRFYPEPIAQLIENTGRAFKTDSDISGFLTAADEINKVWKATTLLHPSWTIRDVLGNLFLAANAEISPLAMAKQAKDATRILSAHNRGDFEALKKLTVTIAGRTMTGEDIMNHARNGVTGSSVWQDSMMHLLANGMYMGPTSQSLLRNPKAALSEIWNRAGKSAAVSAQESAIDRIPGFTKLRQIKQATFDHGLASRVWAPFARANGMANDWMRLTAFMAQMDKGSDPVSAARYISEKLLDMGTSMPFEENLRRLFPFYSWARASGVYGVQQILRNPKFITMAPKIRDAIEESVNGESNIPRHMRPRWLQEQISMQLGTDPDNRTAFLLGNLSPAEAATHFLNGAASPFLGQANMVDAIAYFGNSLSPAIKAGMEITAGKEFFGGRTISPDPNMGDMTPFEYGANLIRPIRELGVGVRKGPLPAAFERSPVQGVSRLLIGGGLQPFDDERIKFNLIREANEKKAGLMRRIRLAEREGNKEASLRARVDLMHLYKRMQEQGIGDEVPKGVGKQLETVSAPGA